MDEFTTTRAMRFLPLAVLTTFVIAVVPVIAAWWLRAARVLSSAWVSVAVAMFLSLVLSAVGSQWWRRRRQSTDVLFSELLLWGWVRRYRVERQLAGATSMLGLQPGASPSPTAESTERREELLKQLSAAIDAQDPFLDGHSRRVARYSATIARCMGLSDEEVRTIRTAGAVHDVGKLRVPPELLRKPSPLTDAEFEAVMRHADEGADMVACLGDRNLTEIVRHHHERVDGLGYPLGLRGDAIPLGARIVAVADTFDAITSARPYRPAAQHKQALDVLEANAGTQLDPAIVRTFLKYYSGRKASVFWIFLAVSPQRAVAWMRGPHSGAPAPSMPRGELAASTLGRVAFVAATVGTTVAVGVAHSDNPAVHRANGVQVAAAAPLPLQAGAGPRSPRGHASASRPTAQPVQAVGAVLAKDSRALVRAPLVPVKPGHGSAPGRAGSPGGTAAPVGGGGGSPGGGGAPPGTSGSAPSNTSPQHQATHQGGTPAPAVPAPNSSPAPAVVPPPPAAVTTPAPPTAAPVSNPPPPTSPGGRHHPIHNGPGDGGWGPGGRPPHNGPGDGGWGPGGNPQADAPAVAPAVSVPPAGAGAPGGPQHAGRGH